MTTIFTRFYCFITSSTVTDVLLYKALHSLSLSDLRLETGLDGRHRSGGSTCFTAQEMQSVGGLSLQFGVHRLTCLTRHILKNVTS